MRLADVLKAAGEPTRLRLLNLLRHGDICVCDLQAVLGLPQHTVSRHLAALRHAGLVVDERNGQRVVYSLVPAPTAELKALRRLLEACCPRERVFQVDLRRLQQTVRREWGRRNKGSFVEKPFALGRLRVRPNRALSRKSGWPA